MERRLERIRRNNLRKKEKPGMPKFLMFMQQNMMNQMMLAASMQENPEQMDEFPRIIPVPIDPRKRILPMTTNPFINFERNQPRVNQKDMELDYQGLDALLQQRDEMQNGAEKSTSSESENSSSGSRTDFSDSSMTLPTVSKKLSPPQMSQPRKNYPDVNADFE